MFLPLSQSAICQLLPTWLATAKQAISPSSFTPLSSQEQAPHGVANVLTISFDRQSRGSHRIPYHLVFKPALSTSLTSPYDAARHFPLSLLPATPKSSADLVVQAARFSIRNITSVDIKGRWYLSAMSSLLSSSLDSNSNQTFLRASLRIFD